MINEHICLIIRHITAIFNLKNNKKYPNGRSPSWLQGAKQAKWSPPPIFVVMRITFTLSEIAEQIGTAVEEQFPEDVWVVADITSFSVNASSGHCYMDLSDKVGSTEAKMKANIWKTKYRMISDFFVQQTGQALNKGIRVLLRGTIGYHPTFGLALSVLEIDPAFTMGEQKLKRERILTDLREGGFTEIQKTLPYPTVPQRVAIVSSQGAAGFEDFCNQLENNVYGFHFELALFQSVMQGTGVEPDVVAAFKQIEGMAAEFDVVVILRGGGAESDLFGFDSFAIGEAIACCPIPVLSGIGHEKDWTVPDFVAFKREKTPTAVAASLIQSCLDYAQAVEGFAADVLAYAEQAISQKQDALRALENKILRSPKNKLGREAERLEYRINNLKQSAQNQLRNKQQKIDLAEAKLGLLNPETILQKGYSITTKAGKTVRLASQVQPGDALQTTFLDGKVASVVS